MPIRIIFFLVLLAALTLWQGCGQSDFNDSELNRSVTQADDDSSNNSNDDDSTDHQRVPPPGLDRAVGDFLF